MNDVALASMQISSARLGMQYSMSMQKMSMTDMEQQAMGELEMLPPDTSGGANFTHTYASTNTGGTAHHALYRRFSFH